MWYWSLHVVDLIYLMLTPWFLAVGIWLAFNAKRIPDKINLWIPSRRARAVLVRMRTRSGRTIELVRLPDDRGIIHWNGGAYVFHQDCATTNARLRIPEITFLEGQPHPEYGDIAVVESEMVVEVPQPEGGFVREKRKVPSYIQQMRKTTPEKLKGYTATEIETALNNKIVQDIITATSNELGQIRLILMLTIGAVAVSILGDYLLWTQISSTQEAIQALRQSIARLVPV